MITADIQTLEPGNVITLYEVDATNIGGDLLRFHGHEQETSIYWQGEEFKPWPVAASGFKKTTDAQQPTPSLVVGDIGASISTMCVYLDDMVGATVRRRRTLGRYLDAANFADGNPNADPDAEMGVEIWRIESKPEELPGKQVTFSLSTPLDFGGQQIPALQIIPICQHTYKDADCGWTPVAFYDANDKPVDDPALDDCSMKMSGCECRFGLDNPLSFGGFLCDVLQ